MTSLYNDRKRTQIQPMQPILLASSSIYRQQLLQTLGLEFSHQSPNIDETALVGESAKQLTARLAQEKAQTFVRSHPSHLIIASDQAATLNNSILNKPGSHQNAIAQLESCSGETVTFYTSLCLLNTHNQRQQLSVESYTVKFRALNYQQIERYICKEQPYDCAGSFKMEGLGISLFEKINGDDPNTLIGLPLIRLVEMLGNEGIEIP